MRLAYPVTLEPQGDGTVLVSFPDIPEAVSEGGTTEGAVRRLLDLDHRSHVDRVEAALRLLGEPLVVTTQAA